MEILKKILLNKTNRLALIREFQELVWNNDHSSNILSELAYDLDFYEPNDDERKKEITYFGDEKLEKLINETLDKLSMRDS